MLNSKRKQILLSIILTLLLLIIVIMPACICKSNKCIAEKFSISNGKYKNLSKSIPGDVNGDGVVDVLDILLVLAAWEQTGNPGWIS